MAKNKSDKIEVSDVEKEKVLTKEELVKLVNKNAKVSLAITQLEKMGVLTVVYSKDKESKSFKNFQLLQQLIIENNGMVLATVSNDNDKFASATLLLQVNGKYPTLFNFDHYED